MDVSAALMRFVVFSMQLASMGPRRHSSASSVALIDSECCLSPPAVPAGASTCAACPAGTFYDSTGESTCGIWWPMGMAAGHIWARSRHPVFVGVLDTRCIVCARVHMTHAVQRIEFACVHMTHTRNPHAHKHLHTCTYPPTEQITHT